MPGHSAEKPEVMMMSKQRPAPMAQLEARYTLLRADLAEDPRAFVAQHGASCRALIANGSVTVDAELLDAMPKLEILACGSAGYDTFSLPDLSARGIALCNASPALSDDVADTAIMLMLSARRGMVPGDAWVRSGQWARDGAMPLMRSVRGKVLGIVGMGTIGQAIATRGAALGMEVAYWNRSARDVPWRRVDDLIALAREADTLVAIVPGGAATEGLISGEVMTALGPEGLLINVARGSVVDEDALIAALSEGRLGHAALDVFVNEPDPNPRLRALENTTFYPHHASGTVETRDAMGQTVVDNLAAFHEGRALVSPIAL